MAAAPGGAEAMHPAPGTREQQVTVRNAMLERYPINRIPKPLSHCRIFGRKTGFHFS
jgi:hypothetical protein